MTPQEKAFELYNNVKLLYRDKDNNIFEISHEERKGIAYNIAREILYNPRKYIKWKIGSLAKIYDDTKYYTEVLNEIAKL